LAGICQSDTQDLHTCAACVAINLVLHDGVVYIVNNDGSVLPIDGGDGRIPATDASANCWFAEPPGGQAEHLEATDINGGAAAVDVKCFRGFRTFAFWSLPEAQGGIARLCEHAGALHLDL
jgi:hypothetical protein